MSSFSSHAVFGQIVESAPSRLKRCYLDRKVDAGSVPESTTKIAKVSLYRLAFFVREARGMAAAGALSSRAANRSTGPLPPLLASLLSVSLWLSRERSRGES